MNTKELHSLTRKELLEILVDQGRELEAARKELEDVRAELETVKQENENRHMEITEAGSIAEAALRINGIFETAQKAADEYIGEIEYLRDKLKTLAEEEDASHEQ